MPVSAIESDEPVDVEIAARDVREALDALCTQAESYRWRTVMGRYVLFPADSVWESEISGVAIADVPRLDAATRYVIAVRSQISALEDLVEPPIKGDPRAPVYTEPVTLSRESSILAHLVELLGTNEQLAFTVERARSGKRVLHFEQVTTRQPQSSGDDLG